MITVNIFFVHFVKEISITKYGNDKQLIPAFLPYEIYQYSDSVFKHLPEDSLKKLEKTMLYSKHSVYYNKTTINRRTHNRNTANDKTDLNIDNRITKFQDQLKNEYVYRIPLRYFTDLCKINFPLKIDFRIKCHLETEMKKLFKSKKKEQQLQLHTPKSFLQGCPLYNMNNFCWTKISGSTWKQYWFLKKS